MIIQSIDLIRARLPFHAPFRIAISSAAWSDNVFVRIHSSEGVYGIGEASPSPAITGDTADTMMAAGRELARMLIGQDASDLEGLNRAMSGRLAGHPTIRSGFDMALYDLAAKRAGQPLYRFLGGGRRTLTTDNTVGLDTVEVMAETAATFVEQGFRAIKTKLGEQPDVDIARVRAIRQAIGPDIPIRLDANQGWDVPGAIQVLNAVDGLGVQYCEQPVTRWNLAGLRQIRDRVRIPIMADESVFDHRDALALVRGECCDYLNIKLSKSGGIRTAIRIAAVADAAGMACMVGCMSETRLGLSAAAHFISAFPIVRFSDLDSHVDHTIDPVVGGIEFVGGTVTLPETPGHGADLAPDFLEALPVETITAHEVSTV